MFNFKNANNIKSIKKSYASPYNTNKLWDVAISMKTDLFETLHFTDLKMVL